MKKILVILTTLILTSAFAQVTPSIKYPRFEVDSLGQKVVVMTIPQAMKLNNNSDLLEKFEAQDIRMKEYETLCVKVISEKDVVIAKLSLIIQSLQLLKVQILMMQRIQLIFVIKIEMGLPQDCIKKTA